MKHVLACALVVAPAIAFADCTSESAFLRAAFESRGYEITRIGTVSEDQGTCRLTDILVEQAVVTLSAAEISWRVDGFDALTTNDGRLSFNADITNLVVSARAEDRWISYMLAEQNRRNTIDISISSSWDFPSGTLELTSLDIDLPGDNRLVYEFRVTGASTALLTGNPAALQAMSLDHMALEIENVGFADALILGPLITALSDIPGAPETVVEGTKRDLRALVTNLPSDVFDADTKVALTKLINAGPAPWGEVTMTIVANPKINLAPFFAGALQNITPDSISALFQGGRVDVTFVEDMTQN